MGGYSAAGTSAGAGQAASGLSADPRAAAEQEAIEILALARVPSGAQALPSPLPGAPQLDIPGLTYSDPDLVDLSALWTVPGTMSGVCGWELANPPAGGSVVVRGGGGPSLAGEVSVVVWEFSPTTPSIQSPELEVTVAQVAGQVVGIRVDAMISYFPARPAGSLISPGAVARMSAGSGQCGAGPCTAGLGQSSDASQIDALVSTLDILPAAPDAPVSCGLVTGGSDFAVRLTGAAGAPVATVGGTWGCPGFWVAVPGMGRVGLADPTRAFAQLLGADFGIPKSLHLGVG